jgi:glycosyltransferase involved in cell wall biosynthesis
MRILIDVTQIPVKKGGVGIYALNLIREIAKLDFDNYYYILIQSDEHSFDDLRREKFHIISIPNVIFRKLIFRLLLEQCLIPYFVIKYRIDIVHSLHYSFPFLNFGSKRVVTIHDMTFFKYPEYHKFIKRFYFKFFIYLIPRLADKIISISESSLEDFLLLTGAQREKVSVIHLGSPGWSPFSFHNDGVELIKRKYGIDNEYVLFVGTLEPRKNIVNLILAFNKLLEINDNYKLVIAGGKGWDYRQVFDQVDRLNLHDSVIFTGFVDEQEKPYVIKGARIFVYPSLYEGFGLPVLEALSLGVPTITSRMSSLPEVAGDGALLADPTNVDELFGCMKRLLDDKTLYEELKVKGLLQAKRFRWTETAEKTINVYRSVGARVTGLG